MFLDLLNAVLKLGLPMAGASWFLFQRLYGSGNIERTANRSALNTHMKTLKAEFKAAKKTRRQKQKEKEQQDADAAARAPRSHADLVFDKWMWFGSGFYGLAALWTFVVIEVSDVYNFIFHFPGLGTLFADGVFELILSVILNQLQNIVTAFIWFSFWDADSILLWVLIAYGGYWIGVEVARRELTVPVTWRERLRELVKSRLP